MKVSVVIPTYRNAGTLPELHRRLSGVLDQFTADWEVVLVDDASNDGTWQALEALHEQDPRVKLVRFASNMGQHHATLCGIQRATGDYVVTIDDDLQNPPEEIPRLIAKLDEGYDIVIGSIGGDKKHSSFRNLASRTVQGFIGVILDKPDDLELTAYRAMTRRAADQIGAFTGAHVYLPGLMLSSVPHDRITNLPVEHHDRVGGRSTYTFRKLVKLFSYLLINHSFLPLRLVTGFGLLVCVVSFCYAIGVAVYALAIGTQVAGFPTLAILVSFLSGSVLLALGVIGEYVGRLVEEGSRPRQFPVFEERG
jgi:glycosyltransferase involved in cell wall biosynthesis